MMFPRTIENKPPPRENFHRATSMPLVNVNFLGELLDNRYRLDDIIDQGGMGVVLRARQLTMNRDVAIKMLLPNLLDSDVAVERFKREMQLASLIRHPNVVQLFDYGESQNGSPYLVMELLQGQTLKKILASEGKLPLQRAAQITHQIASGVAAAHEHDIVHRDLKPANIFLTPPSTATNHRESVKLLDFGVAKSLRPGASELTTTGQLCGTTAYLAPELIHGAHAAKRSDVFSIGLIALEMILGSRVYDAPVLGQLVWLQTHATIPTPPSLKNTPWESFIHHCLHLNPNQRTQDANQLTSLLQPLLSYQPPVERLPQHEVDAFFHQLRQSAGMEHLADISDDLLPINDEGPTAILSQSQLQIPLTPDPSQSLDDLTAPRPTHQLVLLGSAALAFLLLAAVAFVLLDKSPPSTTNPPLEGRAIPSDPSTSTSAAATPDPNKQDTPQTLDETTAKPSPQANAQDTPPNDAQDQAQAEAQTTTNTPATNSSAKKKRARRRSPKPDKPKAFHVPKL